MPAIGNRPAGQSLILGGCQLTRNGLLANKYSLVALFLLTVAQSSLFGSQFANRASLELKPSVNGKAVFISELVRVRSGYTFAPSTTRRLGEI